MSSREALPYRRPCVTYAIKSNGGTEYGTVGYYPDGRPGEIFLDIGKPGTDVNVAAKESAVAASLALQYGVPVKTLKHAIPQCEEGPVSGWLRRFLDMAKDESEGDA